jgi:hypothetical protein
MTTFFDTPIISATRRNHGLEHAAIHLLAERFPDRSFAGHSNPTGFFLIGDASTKDVRECVSQALSRMQNGEASLAVHPGCGTNYAVLGGLVSFLALLGFVGTRDSRERWDRLPFVMILTTLGLIFGQPLALLTQKHVTTSGDPEGLEIVDVYQVSKNTHRIVTRG